LPVGIYLFAHARFILWGPKQTRMIRERRNLLQDLLLGRRFGAEPEKGRGQQCAKSGEVVRGVCPYAWDLFQVHEDRLTLMSIQRLDEFYLPDFARPWLHPRSLVGGL
jgi:hypothetical protein